MGCSISRITVSTSARPQRRSSPLPSAAINAGNQVPLLYGGDFPAIDLKAQATSNISDFARRSSGFDCLLSDSFEAEYLAVNSRSCRSSQSEPMNFPPTGDAFAGKRKDNRTSGADTCTNSLWRAAIVHFAAGVIRPRLCIKLLARPAIVSSSSRVSAVACRPRFNATSCAISLHRSINRSSDSAANLGRGLSNCRSSLESAGGRCVGLLHQVITA